MVRKYIKRLKKRKETLIKFLFSVDWNNEESINEAIKLFEEWEKPDINQAIVMLSGLFSLHSA